MTKALVASTAVARPSAHWKRSRDTDSLPGVDDLRVMTDEGAK
jgi:hypothetical protein